MPRSRITASGSCAIEADRFLAMAVDEFLNVQEKDNRE
jgi:hypothetical protein